ncbi:unnamed protein product [Musa textilis]
MCSSTRSMSPSRLIHRICTYHKFYVCCKMPTRLGWQRNAMVFARVPSSHISIHSIFPIYITV